jgi:hypothetical protein
LGVLAYVGRDDAVGAEQALRKAIRLDPAYAEAYNQLATVLSNIGKHDEAIWAVTEALKLEPLSAIYNLNLAGRRFFLRDFEAAVQQLEFTLELHPGFAPAWKYKAFFLASIHRYDEAEEAFRSWGEHAGIAPELARGLGSLVSAFGRTGVPERLPPAFETLPGLSPGDATRLAVLVGDYSRALDLLEPGEDQVWPWVFAIHTDPILDPLRSDPRFLALSGRKKREGPR